MRRPSLPQGRWNLAARVGGLLCASFLIVGLLIYLGLFRTGTPVPIRISGGPPGGTYDDLAQGLANVLQNELDLKPGDVRALESSGSLENVERLDAGEAELSFVQNDTLVESRARTVALLYEEVLHILVDTDAQPPIRTVEDLRGRTVSLGLQGSGTESVARRVLEHFGLTPVVGATDDPEAVRVVTLEPEDAIASFSEPNGKLDATFVLSAIPSKAVHDVCSAGEARLLTLGDGPQGGAPSDAMAAVFPFYSAFTIPARTYDAAPKAPVNTLSVTALLAARNDADPELIRRVAAALFERRPAIAEYHHVAIRFRERYEPLEAQIPFHDGAIAFYLRDRPPFLIEYADAWSFFLSLLAAGISFTVAAVAFLRQRDKDRIDEFYMELEAVTERIDSEDADFDALRARLGEIRRSAFRRLVNEEFPADTSFLIFQDYLRALSTEIEARRRSEDAPGG